MNKKVLVISVHPDDETLGCGGTLLKHKSHGDQLIWLIITNINDKDLWGTDRINTRQQEIKQVAIRYGFEETIKLDYDTTTLDQVPIGELINKLSEVLRKHKPQIVYLHNRCDIHTDHKFSFEAIISASKSFNNPFLENVLMYETISETDFAPALQANAFTPNYFVDISDHIDQKIEIMQIYASEIKKHPFPRSEKNIRALATQRGAQCGVNAAEAFMILKLIWK